MSEPLGGALARNIHAEFPRLSPIGFSKDGIPNLVEYAIAGQDPTVPNPNIGSFDGQTLSFTKRGVTSGLTYAIEESTDLGIGDDWDEVTHNPPNNPYVNDATTISHTLTPGTPAENFLRLRVNQAP